MAEKGHGKPLLLIHGFDSSLFTWRYNFNTLASKYRVIAIDLPGFGLSDNLPIYDVSLSSYIIFLTALLKTMKINKASLVGHSFGGTLCILFCNKYGDLVKKLILVSAPSPSIIKPEGKKFKNLLMFMYYRKSFVNKELAEIIRLSRQNKSSKDMATAIQEEHKRQGSIKCKLSNQCHIIWGQNDALFSPEIATKSRAHFLFSEISFFDKCGHVPHEERSAEFNKIALRFLS